MGLTAEAGWPILLRVSADVWITCAPGAAEGDPWLRVPDGTRRRLDDTHPAIGCLPLLERSYASVKEERDRAVLAQDGAVRTSLERLVPAGVVEAALDISTDYWLRLALDWAAELGPRPERMAWAGSIEEQGRAQDLRHAARRLRRTWARSGG